MVFFWGIGLFFGVHAVGLFPRLRIQLVNTIGQNAYLGLYSLMSVAALACLVVGFDSSYHLLSSTLVTDVYSTGRYWMFLSFWLLISANLPTYVKRWTYHPMTWGIVIWGVGHLLVNPDLHSRVLFGTFVVFVVVSAITSSRRSRPTGESKPKAVLDLVCFCLALLLTYLAGQFHGSFTAVTLPL
jgi:uncharacterized membrane protein